LLRFGLVAVLHLSYTDSCSTSYLFAWRRQAYGAGRYHLVGLVLQRALLLLTLVAAAVTVLWTQAEPILLALGQDPDIAHGTAQFLLRCGRLQLAALACHLPSAAARLLGWSLIQFIYTLLGGVLVWTSPTSKLWC
jgi:Na+-driven multidrug efflux pump